MNTSDTAGSDAHQNAGDSALDRAADQGPLPEAVDDDEPNGGAADHVQDSTVEEANASFLGIHLEP